MPTPVRFELEWREKLVCTMDGKRFTLYVTMGILTVYFPTKLTWEASAPDWAKGQWERVKEDLSAWCLHENIPLESDDVAGVEFG